MQPENDFRTRRFPAARAGDGGFPLAFGAAQLAGADLQGRDLRGAPLAGADLRAANLRGADLRGADLRWALLDGADLTGADLRGALLQSPLPDAGENRAAAPPAGERMPT